MSTESTGSLARPSAVPAAAHTAASAVGGAIPDVRPFFGWRIVGVAFVAQLLSNGVTLSAFSNFLEPVSQAFGTTRGTIALGVPLAIACMGILSPFVGRMIDLGHARRLMTSGALLAGSGLILLSRAEDLRVAAFLFVGFVCVGSALFGIMPSMALVASWFVKRRGLALGLSMSGATVVSYVAPASAQLLIDLGDWRTAVLCFGVVLVTVGAPVFAFFTIGRPEAVGQLPDGEQLDPMSIPAVSTIRSPRELVRDPRLWLVSLGFGLIMTSPVVLLTLVIPYGTSLGFSGQDANLFFAAMVPFSLLGKVVIGTWVDRAPAKPLLALIVVMNVLVWLIFYSVPGFSLYIAAGAAYGLGIGGAAPVQGVVLGRCFGRANYGTASGLGGLLAIGLLVVASTMSSVLQGERGEGYPTIFLMQASLLLLGGLLLGLVRIPTLAEAVD